jgi:uronate dehydrogenase
VNAGLAASFDGVRTVWGISANRDAWWDLSAGHAIGYHPLDDSASFGDVTARSEDDAEGRHVGGPFALPESARRPFDKESP